MTRGYPYRTPSYELNLLLGRWFLDGDEPLWLKTESYKDCPLMELNVSSEFQRKIFYFPKAYSRFWLEAPFGRYLRSVLREGDVFLDIGSNIGYYTLMAAAIVGNEGAVYAFEPEPTTFESISRSVQLNGFTNVTCVNRAMSNARGEFEFFRTSGTAHSLISATTTETRFRDVTRVQVTTGDEWAGSSDLKPEKIRLIKIDVEGEEPRTMEGMKETLGRAGCPPIWCEVRGPQGSTRAPNTFAACVEQLAPLGYRSYFWKDGDAREVGVADVVGREDVLFMRPA